MGIESDSKFGPLSVTTTMVKVWAAVIPSEVPVTVIFCELPVADVHVTRPVLGSMDMPEGTVPERP